jgi:hypothetical protein
MNGSLQLGSTVNTLDVAVALQGEYGIFRVVTPKGESMLVTCERGHSISHVALEDRNSNQPFRITKITDAPQGQQQLQNQNNNQTWDPNQTQR